MSLPSRRRQAGLFEQLRHAAHLVEGVGRVLAQQPRAAGPRRRCRSRGRASPGAAGAPARRRWLRSRMMSIASSRPTGVVAGEGVAAAQGPARDLLDQVGHLHEVVLQLVVLQQRLHRLLSWRAHLLRHAREQRRHLRRLLLHVVDQVFDAVDVGREELPEAVHEVAEVLLGGAAAHVLRQQLVQRLRSSRASGPGPPASCARRPCCMHAELIARASSGAAR